MKSLAAGGLNIENVPLDDTGLLTAVARQNERKNWVASRVGLPTIGSSMVNRHGIEWVVQNHEAAPTSDTLQRWRNKDVRPESDLYPVVAPKNLSRQLCEFIAAIDRCTTKGFAILDTMPGRRKDGHVPGGNSIDTLAHPQTNLLFLDVERVNETVIAHEFGHAWVQYVDECEDLRTLEDASDPQRLRQVSFVQSFVLDLKVNELLERKGFDMSPIREDQAASMIQLARAVRAGYRPKYPGEEVFMALLVADELVQQDLGLGCSLATIDNSIEMIRGTLASVSGLADRCAESVRKHGYDSKTAIASCIDECLLASFEHCGSRFDIDAELVLVEPEEPNIDKFPSWLPQLPPRSKCRVGKYMARNEISSDWRYRIEPSFTGKAKVLFTSPELDRQRVIQLSDRVGPPTRYDHLPDSIAEDLAMKVYNQTGSYQLYGGPPHAVQTAVSAAIEMAESCRSNQTRNGDPGPDPRMFQHKLGFPGRPYMAGFGSWLTAARWSEQLKGEHPYGYAANNPVTYSDPSGLDPATQCGNDAAYNLCLRCQQSPTPGCNAQCTQAAQAYYLCRHGYSADFNNWFVTQSGVIPLHPPPFIPPYGGLTGGESRASDADKIARCVAAGMGNLSGVDTFNPVPCGQCCGQDPQCLNECNNMFWFFEVNLLMSAGKGPDV